MLAEFPEITISAALLTIDERNSWPSRPHSFTEQGEYQP